MSPVLSPSKNYQNRNQHAMCRSGASVAGMTQRWRQGVHVFLPFSLFCRPNIKPPLQSLRVFSAFRLGNDQDTYRATRCVLSLPQKRLKKKKGIQECDVFFPPSFYLGCYQIHTALKHVSVFLVSGLWNIQNIMSSADMAFSLFSLLISKWSNCS